MHIGDCGHYRVWLRGGGSGGGGDNGCSMIVMAPGNINVIVMYS